MLQKRSSDACIATNVTLAIEATSINTAQRIITQCGLSCVWCSGVATLEASRMRKGGLCVDIVICMHPTYTLCILVIDVIAQQER